MKSKYGEFAGQSCLSRVSGRLSAGLLLLVLAGCGGKASNTGGTGSETSWLSMCSEDSDCGEGQCLCGVCTKVCETGGCSEVSEDATCTPEEEVASCAGYEPQGHRICVEPEMRVDEAEKTDGGAESDEDADGGSSDQQAEVGEDGEGTTEGGEDLEERLQAGPTDPEEVKLSELDSPLSSTDKVDLLFVIDNSISMADKQSILASALPDLVDSLASPKCVDAEGAIVSAPETASEECPAGSERQFTPIQDMHIGVITTSLGGYGAPHDCVTKVEKENSEQTEDMAHLLGSLSRGASPAAPNGFLEWTDDSSRGEFSGSFIDMVVSAGEFGCGWESGLEAWYRFLVEPYPYTRVVRQNCPFGGDDRQSCIGPETNAEGLILVDQVILDQRRQFLRADSALGIIMLSDENDCSFRASGQSWRLAQAITNDGTSINSAFRGTTVCEEDPDSECCHSCGSPPPSGCPSAVNEEGQTVGAGCENGTKFPTADVVNGIPSEDEINLRCFQQKRRFGVDYLYPVERYSKALTLREICPFADDLDPESAYCETDDPEVPLTTPNPIFDDLDYYDRVLLDPGAERTLPRDARLVFLTGIVGVPWQDLAQQDSNGAIIEPMILRDPVSQSPGAALNWDWILGDRQAAIPNPQDPLMLEQIEPRTGVNPATGAELAPPGSSSPEANPINGHEWNIADRSDLQYACTFDLAQPVTCLTEAEDIELRAQGLAVPSCTCTDYGDEGSANPLCQASDGSYGLTQYKAKAYPSVRQLQVLHDMGERGVVASICPAQTSDVSASDFGYRPAAEAILRQLGRILPR